MVLKTNKLLPLLAALAVVILGFVAYTRFRDPPPISAGPVLTTAPVPGVDPQANKGSVLAGGALPPARSADADTPNDTLRGVTASNLQVRKTAEQAIEDTRKTNERLNQFIASQPAYEERIVQAVTARMAGQMTANAPSAASSAPGAAAGLFDNGVAAAKTMLGTVQAGAAGGAGGASGQATPKVDGAGIPSGLGFDPASAKPVLLLPAGYRSETKDGKTAIVRGLTERADARKVASEVASTPETTATNTGARDAKPEPVPHFTIPENATLSQSVAMTTLVGRVPIDGRVTDPMQFKLLVGRENLAASGLYVPDDVAGVVVSGIAIGDQALSCTEGLIHSLTFVFDDGMIRTVSQRSNGASAGLQGGGGGGNGGRSITQAAKLGWISDAFGNPCVPGRFVTNAPAYLSDVIGAKAFSVAGAAVAAAETTVTTGASALGSSTSSTVTGDRGRYVLGRTVSAGTDEVVNWLMRRLNNSFDAVVVPAATRLVVHIDQEITIDRDPGGRKLDYGRGRMALARQQGDRHGLD